MTSKRGKSEQNGRSQSRGDVSMWEMAIGREIDWQGGRNLPDSNLYMLINQLNCDVIFRVGESEELIPAHKYMLTSRSYVFQEMFSESETIMEENDEIMVKDIDPATFRHMLVFLYTDDVRLNPDNVSQLLYAAQKYRIKNLRSRCLQYLEADLSPDSACVIMEQAHVYNEDDLRNKAMAYILKTGDGTLRAQTVGELCHECLSMIFASDDLNAPEDLVFLAALYWSECELNRQEKEITPEGRREVLGDAVYKIRFPIMDKKFFVQNVSPYGILNDVETNTILQYYVCPEMGATPFSIVPRKGKFVRPDEYVEPKMDDPLPTSRPLESPLLAVDLPPLMIEQDGTPPTGNKKGQEAKGKDKKDKGKKKKKVHLPDTNLLRFSTRDELLSWACDGQRDDAIDFACDHDFVLVGFLVFGPSQFVRGTYYIRARVQDDKQNVVRGSQLAVEVDANPRDKYYAIPFQRPIDIEKMRKYTLIVNLRGEPTFQGSNGNHTVLLDDMTFKFFDSDLSQNGTNVQGGQIPGLVVNTD